MNRCRSKIAAKSCFCHKKPTRERRRSRILRFFHIIYKNANEYVPSQLFNVTFASSYVAFNLNFMCRLTSNIQLSSFQNLSRSSLVECLAFQFEQYFNFSLLLFFLPTTSWWPNYYTHHVQGIRESQCSHLLLELIGERKRECVMMSESWKGAEHWKYALFVVIITRKNNTQKCPYDGELTNFTCNYPSLWFEQNKSYFVWHWSKFLHQFYI